MDTLTWMVVVIGVLVLCAMQVWVGVILRQMRRESEVSLAEMRLGAARIAALAAEVLGRPRP
jgi:Tfp pilus assembly protein PilE